MTNKELLKWLDKKEIMKAPKKGKKIGLIAVGVVVGAISGFVLP